MGDRALAAEAGLAAEKLAERGHVYLVQLCGMCHGRGVTRHDGTLEPCSLCEGQGRTWSGGYYGNTNQLSDRMLVGAWAIAVAGNAAGIAAAKRTSKSQ